MDLTRLYIKQCAGAVELQQLWEPQTGDWVFIDLPEEFVDPVVLQRENSWPKGVYVLMANWKPKDAVWLLRQDQLQGIIAPHYLEDGEVDYVEMFEDCLNYLPILLDTRSPEQMWIHLVMRYFGKYWDEQEEKWVGRRFERCV